MPAHFLISVPSPRIKPQDGHAQAQDSQERFARIYTVKMGMDKHKTNKSVLPGSPPSRWGMDKRKMNKSSSLHIKPQDGHAQAQDEQSVLPRIYAVKMGMDKRNMKNSVMPGYTPSRWAWTSAR